MLAVTPFLFSIILAGLLVFAPHGWIFSVVSLIAGFLAMAAIQAFLVPLVPRGA